MPIHHLSSDTPRPCNKYSIVGQYAIQKFVRHAALLKNDTTLRFGAENTPVWHMGPPLVAGQRTMAGASDEQKTTTAHVVGSVHLGPDDIEGIETWLAEVDKEDRPLGSSARIILAQYRVDPPMHWVVANNGIKRYRQFSCVGFVMNCYRFININLIDDSRPERLPDVTFEEVEAGYGEEVRNDGLRRRLGIDGPGPWKLILAGYLFHSLNREDAVIRQMPYVPSSIAEKDFPAP